MASIEDYVQGRSSLSADQIHRLRELVADWQLLSDLSFADLILWVPLRKDFKSWPTGYVAVAHIRPTTAATLFPHDVIGEEISYGSRPHIDQALSGAEIIRDTQPEPLGEFMVKEETIPVMVEDQVIGVISRHRNSELMRQPSRLELNYREIAHNLYRMIAEGTFPYPDAGSLFDPAPRVGDGLIRLDVNGVISYASPNARSAFSRLGWISEVEGHVLGDVAQSLARVRPDAHEETIASGLTGKALKRVEIENVGGTIDFTVLPLIRGGDRIGAIVMLNNVTELRRRERELVTKDATIREIHHRVKNNLQTVSALLRLQARRIEDPGASAALNEAVRRIASIALVHETLSNSRDSSVAFDDVLDSLVTHALELSPRMNELRIDRTGQFGSLEPRIATPLALVITELIHNALEHGLAHEGLALGIHVSSTASELSVTISDDGVGFPEGFDIATSPNLGLQIVRTLTENELRGNLSLETDEKETRAVLTFPSV
ncbi:HATPase_EL346-LOV-HK-like domain containing protein [Candidatus Nanopelagicaceae bacterium]|jgi:two-component sensor histidine kinase|uniref:histidine kinase n=1 Tax=freshwater metagenome TaxID=449393 RepID=A0A6J6S7B1_9ZZZZ|nr:histidine kinase [Actinomycetota bacterium]MSY68754.1 histidine kinase [Actinomycetota bacterium]